jgi:DNA polymerase III delta prime subunit
MSGADVQRVLDAIVQSNYTDDFRDFVYALPDEDVGVWPNLTRADHQDLFNAYHQVRDDAQLGPRIAAVLARHGTTTTGAPAPPDPPRQATAQGTRTAAAEQRPPPSTTTVTAAPNTAAAPRGVAAAVQAPAVPPQVPKLPTAVPPASSNPPPSVPPREAPQAVGGRKPETDSVRIAVLHFTDLTYAALHKDPQDKRLVAEFDAFVRKLLCDFRCKTAGEESLNLVRVIQSRDTKGPYRFDPLFGLMRIEVRAHREGMVLAMNRPLRLDRIEHLRSQGGEQATAERSTLEGWLRSVLEANDIAVSPKTALEELRKDGVTELRHLLLVGEDHFKRLKPQAVGAAIIAERNSIGTDPTGSNAAQRAERQQKVIERAQFHKVKRFIYHTNGKLSRLTMLDPAIVDDAIEVIHKEYSNPTVVELLKSEFLKPFTVHGPMPRGLLLHGPPGTGKTMLVLLLCDLCGLTMVEPSMMSAGEINRGIVGETEKLLAEMFRRALFMPWLPFIVAIDEIDSAVPKRDEGSGGDNHGADKVSVFLANIQGGTDIANLALVGATNRRECIDDAIRRRLEIQIFLGFLDGDSRRTFVRRALLGAAMHASYRVVLDALPQLHALASSAANKGDFLRMAQDTIPEEAHAGVFLFAADAIFAQRRAPLATALTTLKQRLCAPQDFFSVIEDELVRLTLNFSGAALVKTCARLRGDWDDYVRCGAPVKNKLALPIGAPASRSKTYQHSRMLHHLKAVSQADDIRVGTQLCYEVLSKPARVFHQRRLQKLFDRLPQATGLIVVHLNGSEGGQQQITLQIEEYAPETGARYVQSFETRPYCRHCKKFTAEHCHTFGPYGKHVFDADGTPSGQPINSRGMLDEVTEATDEGYELGEVGGGLGVDDVLALLAEVTAERELTQLVFKNMTSFVANGATDDKKCVEDLVASVKRARAPGSRTLLALDLDSIAGVTRSQSEGGMGSVSSSIGNRQLFSYACNCFGEFRTPFDDVNNVGVGEASATSNAAGEWWCVMVTSSDYVMQEFRQLTKWPLTNAERKNEEEAEKKALSRECARCKEQYTEAAQEDDGARPECTYHCGEPARLMINEQGHVILRKFISFDQAREHSVKLALQLQEPEPECPPGATDPEKKTAEKAKYTFKERRKRLLQERVVWTCCFDKAFDAPGCKHEKHSQVRKPQWAPSENIARMLAADA